MKKISDEQFQVDSIFSCNGQLQKCRILFLADHLEIISQNLLDESEVHTLEASQSSMQIHYQQFVGVTYKNSNASLCNVFLYMEDDQLCFQIPENQSQLVKEFLRVRVPQLNFFQNYKLLETIRIGGQGKIIKCQKFKDNHFYVAKIMQRYDIFTQTEVENLKIISQNPHENVLSMHEYYQEYNNTIIVFPYLNGGTLYQYVDEKKKKNQVTNVKKLMKQILLGLSHIHSLSIIHRDIKMDNIMVELDDEVNEETAKIIDFGFSIQNYQHDIKKVRCGTVGYLAPEIANDQRYNEKCDIFSLSQVFHILLTGNPMHDRKMESRKIIQMTKKIEFQIDIKTITCLKARDLLENMKNEQEQRFFARQCLSHSYFKKQLVSEIVEGMQNLFFKSPFRNEK